MSVTTPNDGYGNEPNVEEAAATAPEIIEPGGERESATKARRSLADRVPENRPEEALIRAVNVNPGLFQGKGVHGPVRGTAETTLTPAGWRPFVVDALETLDMKQVRTDRWEHELTGVTAETGTAHNEIWVRAYWPGAHKAHQGWAWVEHINTERDFGRVTDDLGALTVRIDAMIDMTRDHAEDRRAVEAGEIFDLESPESKLRLGFKRLSPEAVIPTRAHRDDAGFDLYLLHNATIDPGQFVDLACGVAVGLPAGFWARITGRSSTLRKHGLLVNEGIIDTGYTGPLYAGVKNVSEKSVVLLAGSRVAQLIVHRNDTELFEPVEVNELDETERGDSGFGSSGI